MRERVGRVARGSGTAGRGRQGVLTFPRKIYTIPSMGEEEGYARGEHTSSIPQGGYMNNRTAIYSLTILRSTNTL